MKHNRNNARVTWLTSAVVGVVGLLSSGCSESTTTSTDQESDDSEATLPSDGTTNAESDAGGAVSSNADAGGPDNETIVDGRSDASSSIDDSDSTLMPDSGSTSGTKRCNAPKGTGSPTTIADVVDLINALPHPVDFECFLESLDRPLGIFATSNVQSAQPAEGKRSPRIFLMIDEFSMSLVPGTGGTLEVGERDESGTRSVKGEVHFPVESELELEDAFTRITFDSATKQSNCGVCHDSEELSAKYPFPTAFLNTVLIPQPFFAVDVSSIRGEYDACDANKEPERCAMLQGLFGHGEVAQKAFP